jgi:hypothetical protein
VCASSNAFRNLTTNNRLAREGWREVFEFETLL